MVQMSRSSLAIRILTLPLLTSAAFLAAGCGNGVLGAAKTSSGSGSGSAFVVGTDAPVASVVSFNVQLESITATDSNGNVVNLLSGQPTVDFARFNGLQGLIDMNDVPAGNLCQRHHYDERFKRHNWVPEHW